MVVDGVDISPPPPCHAGMATALWLVGLLLLALGCTLGLVSLVFGLPGTFVIFASSLLYAWATDFAAIEWTVPAWLFAMALAGEAIEFAAAGAAGGAGGRPSRKVTIAAIAGAFAGGIAGTPFLLGLGSLLGALAGAFAGAALAVMAGGGTVRDSLSSGAAAFRGRALGFLLKSAIAVAMVIIIAVALIR